MHQNDQHYRKIKEMMDAEKRRQMLDQAVGAVLCAGIVLAIALVAHWIRSGGFLQGLLAVLELF